MNLKMKYIMTMYSPVIFNELLFHRQVAEGLGRVVSAGFVSISWNPTNGFECKTYGMSESLGLKPLETDSDKISQFLNQQKS